jgi:hypothetical protein
VVEEVFVGGDVELREQLFVLRADAEEVGDRGVEPGPDPGFGFLRFGLACFGSCGLAAFLSGNRRSRGRDAERLQGVADGLGAIAGVDVGVMQQAGDFGRQQVGQEIGLEIGDEAGQSAADRPVGEPEVAFEFEDAGERLEPPGAGFTRGR